MKIGIIGAGAWGSALGIVAKKSGNDVVLWSYDRTIPHFPGMEEIQITNNLSDLSDATTWLIVTPAAYFRETVIKAREHFCGQSIIICTKGLEPGSGKFMSDVLAEELPDAILGVLSGPQFAAEVANGVPTGSTIAGPKTVQEHGKIALSELILVLSDDIIGTEICSVGKNAVAIISGYYSIKAAGENEKALRFTMAWNEVMNLGMHMGAQMETFLGLCGIGDLFLSATSPTSRNFSAGVSIARGEPPAGTVEGMFALPGLLSRAKKLGVAMPAISEFYESIQ